ncbi:hypothetical protein H8S33_10325 [Ornithinibacillus sp. BX22]|uniref:ComG operon protein 7 n=1 Tax=Ornithinibacillus hominis TaxID=2763055 RepID=A0A923RIH3_9BACI|nr:hypothetical protein [Ornithinibacillus hominis]MBC5637204.1 hypothetical protein [Ornithinibacillus hominis]
MRKRLDFVHNEKGFILPSVLLLTTFVLLNFSTNMLAYQHDLKITYNLIEQINAQTLFQMSYITYKKDYVPQNKDENLTYQFPNGKVNIRSKGYGEFIQLRFNIETNQSKVLFVSEMVKPAPNSNQFQEIE